MQDRDAWDERKEAPCLHRSVSGPKLDHVCVFFFFAANTRDTRPGIRRARRRTLHYTTKTRTDRLLRRRTLHLRPPRRRGAGPRGLGKAQPQARAFRKRREEVDVIRDVVRQDVDELSVIVNDAIRLRRFAHFVGLKRRYVCKVASYDVLSRFSASSSRLFEVL